MKILLVLALIILMSFLVSCVFGAQSPDDTFFSNIFPGLSGKWCGNFKYPWFVGVFENLYTWNGTAWISGGLKGDKGDKGDTGDSGFGQGARLYRTTGQTQAVDNESWVTIQFNGALYDTDSCFSGSSNTVMTCKTAGKYMIGGACNFPASGTGVRVIGIYLQSSYFIALHSGVSDTVYGSSLDLTTTRIMAVGETIQLKVFQNSGGSLNIPVDANYIPCFWFQRVGN